MEWNQTRAEKGQWCLSIDRSIATLIKLKDVQKPSSSFLQTQYGPAPTPAALLPPLVLPLLLLLLPPAATTLVSEALPKCPFRASSNIADRVEHPSVSLTRLVERAGAGVLASLPMWKSPSVLAAVPS